MDIKVLRNFTAIVECGSLTAASKKLFIAQPALSNQLKALEKELNTTLIERNSRRQKLTDSGRLFYEKAKNIIFLENSLIKEISDCEDGTSGCLKIATVPSCAMAMLDEIIPNFIESYPKVTYEIYEKESDHILKMLEDGVVDIGIIRTPCQLTSEMEIFYISEEQLVCAYRSDIFSFPSKGDRIALEDLGDFPIVIIRRYEDMFRKLCETVRFTPNIRNINQQLTINLKWAELGLGVAIIPKFALFSCAVPLSYKEIGGFNFSTKRALVVMKDNYHSSVVKNFLEICKEKL